MGTRNLTLVANNGQYLVAQYCQWDGRPSGQGLKALRFLRDSLERDRFLRQLARARFIDSKELEQLWQASGLAAQAAGPHECARFQKRYPLFSHNLGADILNEIQSASGPILLSSSLTFAADSLFCEWVWVVDFDKNSFECYLGGNRQPLAPNERFASLPPPRENGYYPVRQLLGFHLAALPDDSSFLLACDEKHADWNL